MQCQICISMCSGKNFMTERNRVTILLAVVVANVELFCAKAAQCTVVVVKTKLVFSFINILAKNDV